ncbi:hypothetical protein DFH94DRAFT_694750 [Russula ochroleuca]|uniref:Uncharacterized protein n=1 Tax=Russula ochroleuca TaxID=152965 RepID=A0A9P5MS23_9AGAM|nr:hypothetical protein DFH94DRAFT_694750 [Russula ochroleuca]
MGFFDDDHQHAQDYNNYQEGPKHESHVTHELIAGAAAYEAAKAYEQHKVANGKPVSHEKAKELIAGFAGAFLDKEVETRGLNFIDKEKAKHQAKKYAEQGLSNSGDY